MLEVLSVLAGSAAEELDLQPGDRLMSVNGHEIRDLIDARFYLAEEDLLLIVEKDSGELWELDVELAPGDSIGLEFVHPEPLVCGNNCQFCYVHQLPRGMRKTLYLKDEDYRFSFLYGAYVTLGNLAEADLQRILEQKLSPLYISVHATAEDVRRRLLGKNVEPILPLLRQLVEGGISLHTQVVLCPGINDGDVLEKTISDLSDLRPGVLSLAIVPVGLTAHRQNLPDLRTPTAKESAEILDLVSSFQQKFLADGGRFVFAADEFFLKSGCPIPDATCYEDFPQLENGVGMIADFRQGIPTALQQAGDLPVISAFTLTGKAFFQELKQFAEQLGGETSASLEVVAIDNHLLGPEISVAGLLSGQDILTTLQGTDLGEGLLVPDVVLKEGTDLLLDDMSLDDLSVKLGYPVVAIDASAIGVVEGFRTLAELRNKHNDKIC